MSLKAYPEEWAQHAALRGAARRWQRRRQLTPAQGAAIEATYPLEYYRPEWWARVALLVVGSLGVLSASVVLGMLTDFKLDIGVGAAIMLAGTLTVLELNISGSKHKHYRSGLDNALLYCALLCGAVLLVRLVGERALGSVANPLLWRWLLPMLGLLLAALLRYADPVVAAASFGAALALLANVLLQFSAGRLLLPFAGMLAAGTLLLALRVVPQRADFFYYRAAYLTLRTLGLAILYLAGNYLVVREGNAALQGGYGPSAEIPFAALFWVFTAALPLVYVWLGLRRYDRLLLWLGVLALAFAIYTVRTYHSVLPPAAAATLAGSLLTALALGVLRYLRLPRHGLTAQADDEVRPLVNLESFVQLETAHVPAAPVPGFEFGGGSSGGGGAEGRF